MTPDADDKKKILGLIEHLSFREREIIKLRYGLGDGYTYTLEEVGRIFKITRERVRQIEAKAVRQLLNWSRDAASRVSEGESRRVFDGVQEVLERAKALTPYLMSYLKGHVDDLARVNYRVFEHVIGEFFASWGYEDVRLVGRDPTTAADIFAMQSKGPSGVAVRYMIEVKRWRDHVGVEVIDRVLGAMITERPTHGWHVGMIVTLGGFAEMHKYTVEGLRMRGLELRDHTAVLDWLRRYRLREDGLWLPEPKTRLDPRSID